MSPIIPTEKTFARVFFKKSKKIFCENFSFLVHFSLDKRNFCDSCIFHLTSKNFCDSCIFHLTSKNFCDSCIFHLTSEKFSDSCIFHLTSEILRFVHFSLDTKAKLCSSKSVEFPPFHDSTHYYHLLN